MPKSLEDYRKEIKVTVCRWCGYEGLDKLPIERYPHEGGWEVETIGRVWLYVTCPDCGYQWALWKLEVPR